VDYRRRKLISQDKARCIRGINFSSYYYPSETFPFVYSLWTCATRNSCASRTGYSFYRWWSIFFALVTLSIAKQPSDLSSFFLSLFFSSSRLQKRPAGRRMSTAGWHCGFRRGWHSCCMVNFERDSPCTRVRSYRSSRRSDEFSLVEDISRD
jgi:hypothetical protein